MNEKDKNEFFLTLDVDKKSDPKAIYVNSKDNLLVYLSFLNEKVNIDNDSIDANYLKEQKISSDFNNIKIPISNREKVLDALKRIPQFDINLDELSLVDKKIVHKSNQKNVMISEIPLENSSKMNLYIAYPIRTNEIILDHTHKDHVEAIYLVEACRQACMVTLNKQLGKNTQYFISQESKKFIEKVDRNKNTSIQTYLKLGRKNKGMVICYYSLYQNGKLCIVGYYLVSYKREGNN